MTRKAFLKAYAVRFAAVFALLCLIFYTVYHVFSGSEESLLTVPVRQMTDLQLVSGKAYLFREESLLTVPKGGLVNDLAKSGTKVSLGTPLTEVWQQSDPSNRTEDQLTLDRVNRLIDVLEDSRAPGGTLSAAESYRALANKAFFSLQEALATQNWQAVGKVEDEMLVFLNRYAVITKDGVAVNETLTRLKGVRDQLLTGAKETLSNDSASGYFYDRFCVDGYEGLFTNEALESLTPESFEMLAAAAPQEVLDGVAVGKMVYGYRWSLAIPFGSAEKALFEQGGEYRFSFPENRDLELKMTCQKLIEDGNGGVIAVFECMETPTGFVYHRSQRVEIVANTCQGYYVPESALQIVDGVRGVYIFKDSTVRFRRIEILYEGDGYCIVAEQENRGEDYLALYDILITSGNHLYEGRVYR